jgi:RNA polymerase sigma-70 factor (ECF subfamily)
VTDLEELYRLYHPQVYRFAYYLSGRRAEAEDIAAETFVRLWSARDNLRLPTVKAYLFAIARHLYLDGQRRSRRDADLSDSLVDPTALPDAEAEGRRELEAVLDLLNRLPEPDRSALLLRAGHGMPYDQIAAVLGLSLSAAKVKVHRARVRLAELREGAEKE